MTSGRSPQQHATPCYRDCHSPGTDESRMSPRHLKRPRYEHGRWPGNSRSPTRLEYWEDSRTHSLQRRMTRNSTLIPTPGHPRTCTRPPTTQKSQEHLSPYHSHQSTCSWSQDRPRKKGPHWGLLWVCTWGSKSAQCRRIAWYNSREH